MPERRECTGTEAGRLRRQRDAMAGFAAVALSGADPDRVLAEAARLCAAGLGVPFCAVLEHRPAEGGLLVRAGVGCEPGVAGRFVVPAAGGRAPGAEAVCTGRLVVVPDLRGARGMDVPVACPRRGIASAAAVPIPGDGDRPFGALEAGARGRRGFGPHDLDFLRSFAALLAGALRALRRAAEARAESEAKSALLREQQHRVRNNLMAVAAMLQGGERATAADEGSRARFAAVRRRVFALASLYDHLLGAGLSGEETSLRGYLAALCAGAREFHDLGARGIDVSFEASSDDLRMGVTACTALGVVVNELVANAVEHAFGPAGGRIAVGLGRDGNGGWAVTVEDDGVGVPPEAEGGGVGLGLARRLAERAGASLALRSGPGRTVWTVLLPGDARPPRAGTAASAEPRRACPEPRPAGEPPASVERGSPVRAMEAQAPTM